MTTYRVVRTDLVNQDVLVEALNAYDARERAARQEGMLSREPRFVGVCIGNQTEWYTEELLDQDPELQGS